MWRILAYDCQKSNNLNNWQKSNSWYEQAAITFRANASNVSLSMIAYYGIIWEKKSQFHAILTIYGITILQGYIHESYIA